MGPIEKQRRKLSGWRWWTSLCYPPIEPCPLVHCFCTSGNAVSGVTTPCTTASNCNYFIFHFCSIPRQSADPICSLKRRKIISAGRAVHHLNSPCTYFFIYTVRHFCVGVASSPHLQLFFFPWWWNLKLKQNIQILSSRPASVRTEEKKR